MSLLVDFVVHVLVHVVAVALLWSANVLGNPDNWCGFCDGDDDYNFIFLHHWAGRW